MGKRWRVTLWYRTDNGPVDVEHEIEELEELADLVEGGPHWDALIRAEVTLARRNFEALTIEQASEL